MAGVTLQHARDGQHGQGTLGPQRTQQRDSWDSMVGGAGTPPTPQHQCFQLSRVELGRHGNHLAGRWQPEWTWEAGQV